MHTPVKEFWSGLETGSLPRFSFLEPHWLSILHQGNSYHPNEDVRHAEKFLRQLYERVTTSSLWSKTLLIVTFDEHGGTYDHVPPPWTAIPPDNVSENSGELGFKFNRFGVSVPTILIPHFQFDV